MPARRRPVEEGSLFAAGPEAVPLAARMRPASLDEFVGQQHLLAPGKPLREAIEKGSATSMIFWGPPGTGKTTLGRLLARYADREFVPFSAVTEGVREAKKTPPQRDASYRVQMRYRNFTFPEVATAFREIEAVAPDTVAFTRPTMPEAYRLIRVLYRFINPD